MIVGYASYIELIADITTGKEIVSSGMRQEVQRCRTALALAAAGRIVSLVSSGDPGVYGMAGLTLELARAEGDSVPIEIVPGVTAANAAAASLGAPLMLDFAVISLSDLLVPWPVIRKRLEAIAQADLVVALYNPRSKKRIKQLDEAVEILMASRSASTPVGVVTAAGTENESAVITDLGDLLEQNIGMRSVVIVGNTSTTVSDGKLVTARGYQL